MDGEYIFVYGTLRRAAGDLLNHLVADAVEFVDQGICPGRLYLVDSYPGLVPAKAGGEMVHGEVYRLLRPAEVLARLDRYEGCGAGAAEPTEYIRRKQSVRLASGEIVSAWVYIYIQPYSGLERIASGDFVAGRSPDRGA